MLETDDLCEERAISTEPSISSIDGFVKRLAERPVGVNSANPFDYSLPGNAARRRNLSLYLQEMATRKPSVLLLGEAPGYRGMKLTGVPFTNRAIIENGIELFGLFGPGKGYSVPEEAAPVASEPTATVMWQTLTELAFLPLLWSAYPFHPHRPGVPLSNRTPTSSEIASELESWIALAQLFRVRSVVAVGNIAERSILLSGKEAVKIRHPAHGGKVKFTQGLKDFLAGRLEEDGSAQ